MLILIILAGFFPAILAIAQYCENDKKEKEKNKKEIELKSKIDSLSIKNSQLSTQITSLATENAKLSHQLTETSLLLNSNVIGSDDIDVSVVVASPDQLKISLKNNSNFPSYDVQLVILDYENIIKCDKTIKDESVYIDTKCYKQNITIVPTFNISPKNYVEIPNLIKIRGELIHYGFQIKTRNGIILRHSIFKITPEKVEQSYRIYNFNNEKLTLVKEVNPLKITKKYWEQHFYSQPYIYMQGYE